MQATHPSIDNIWVQGNDAARAAMDYVLAVPDLKGSGMSSGTSELVTVLILLESINRWLFSLLLTRLSPDWRVRKLAPKLGQSMSLLTSRVLGVCPIRLVPSSYQSHDCLCIYQGQGKRIQPLIF